MTTRLAVIVGAGPAGLTAAYELATRTDIVPLVFEADSQVGGISKTVNYKGNRIDIGGHRFFSKSDRVMDWWADVLPLQAGASGAESVTVSYQNKHRDIDLSGGGADPDKVDEVMLVRSRVSRILYGRKFFNYPIKFSGQTLRNLGLIRSAKIIASYLRARLMPIRPEVTLADYVINRFGRELYATFFRDYTEKVWGVPCTQIPADWGAQRIKGVSISALLKHTLKKLRPGGGGDVRQKDTETSLIERFLYPKLGPGQLWEVVARKVEEAGGTIEMNTRVTGVHHAGGKITSVTVEGPGGAREVEAEMVFSSMPVQELIGGWAPPAPDDVRAVAGALPYRDFMTVGVLLSRLSLDGGVTPDELSDRVPDNWIYIQDTDVKVGRLQVFNNWSPYLVASPDTIWLGMEYFVNEGDGFWEMDDAALARFGIGELETLGVALSEDVLDHVVVRTRKAYPAYFGSYEKFDLVQEYVSGFDNLYCVGRNGMHRYNNQDHSILTAMVAVDGIVEGRDTRDAMWQINTEQEYHESR